MNVFTYGSLMFEAVWSRLVTQPRASMLARLDDYERQGIFGELYPGLIPKPQARTEGRLWLGLSPQDVASLDAFEGAAYRRDSVKVTVCARHGGQTQVSAEVYVFLNPAQLTGAPWDTQRFRDVDLPAFLAQYRPAP